MSWVLAFICATSVGQQFAQPVQLHRQRRIAALHPVGELEVLLDEGLRARNPAWGIRALEDVVREAQEAGLCLHTRVPMPANNLLLVFGRG